MGSSPKHPALPPPCGTWESRTIQPNRGAAELQNTILLAVQLGFCSRICINAHPGVDDIHPSRIRCVRQTRARQRCVLHLKRPVISSNWHHVRTSVPLSFTCSVLRCQKNNRSIVQHLQNYRMTWFGSCQQGDHFVVRPPTMSTSDLSHRR